MAKEGKKKIFASILIVLIGIVLVAGAAGLLFVLNRADKSRSIVDIVGEGTKKVEQVNKNLISDTNATLNPSRATAKTYSTRSVESNSWDVRTLVDNAILWQSDIHIVDYLFHATLEAGNIKEFAENKVYSAEGHDDGQTFDTFLKINKTSDKVQIQLQRATTAVWGFELWYNFELKLDKDENVTGLSIAKYSPINFGGFENGFGVIDIDFSTNVLSVFTLYCGRNTSLSAEEIDDFIENFNSDKLTYDKLLTYNYVLAFFGQVDMDDIVSTGKLCEIDKDTQAGAVNNNANKALFDKVYNVVKENKVTRTALARDNAQRIAEIDEALYYAGRRSRVSFVEDSSGNILCYYRDFIEYDDALSMLNIVSTLTKDTYGINSKQHLMIVDLISRIKSMSKYKWLGQYESDSVNFDLGTDAADYPYGPVYMVWKQEENTIEIDFAYVNGEIALI